MDHDVFCDDGPPISQLQAAVKALEQYVFQVVPLPASNAAAAVNGSATNRSRRSGSHSDTDDDDDDDDSDNDESSNSDDDSNDNRAATRPSTTHAATAAAPRATAPTAAAMPTTPAASSHAATTTTATMPGTATMTVTTTAATAPATSTATTTAATTTPLAPPDRRRTTRKLLPTPRPTPVHLFSRQDLALSKWRELARAHVVIYGLGAVGALAAEALVRAGVGKLLLVDHARVEMRSMGAMGYYPNECGFSRIQALRLRLQSIAHTDASTSVESFSADLSTDADLAELKKRLKASAVGVGSSSIVNSRSRPHAPFGGRGDYSSLSGSGSDNGSDSSHGASERLVLDSNMGLFEALTLKRPYDAVLCCADDEVAKLRLNEICLQLSLPLLDVDILPSNAKISLRAVLPGHTCCLECIRQQDAASHAFTPMDQVARSIARAFPACLPHVDATAGGLVAQMAIKLLLDLGEFVPFFTLDMLTFEVESYSFPPSRTCPSAACIERQEEERAAMF